MRNRRAVFPAIAVLALLVLAGCAQQANQAGAIVPQSGISSFIAGFLQSTFILLGVIWNLLSFVLSWGHSDLYQSGMGPWYDLGFLIGLFFSVGIPYFGYRRVRVVRSRRKK